MSSPSAPTLPVVKRVTHAVITTLMCDDDSIYLIAPGHIAVFVSGDRVEVDEMPHQVLVRRERTSTWVPAKRIR